jgi:hypothetical protein
MAPMPQKSSGQGLRLLRLIPISHPMATTSAVNTLTDLTSLGVAMPLIQATVEGTVKFRPQRITLLMIDETRQPHTQTRPQKESVGLPPTMTDLMATNTSKAGTALTLVGASVAVVAVVVAEAVMPMGTSTQVGTCLRNPPLRLQLDPARLLRSTPRILASLQHLRANTVAMDTARNQSPPTTTDLEDRTRVGRL